MTLDLTDDETFALINLLVNMIEADRYPMSPRIGLLPEILAKYGEVGGLSPETRAEASPLMPRRRWLAGQRQTNATRAGCRGKVGPRSADGRRGVGLAVIGSKNCGLSRPGSIRSGA